ncbi:gamma-glutamyltransferase [Qipengyuania gelatinilytica]|uniref:Glutathione hydrolase proenzyme n=1 Tax=Qipengyuania gelatinilytica TaxID=2867231 RepID=A0ABX8ZYN8_9SPHN|nr:gamma-glutamyltransferase [Qipengyuania gelatinilytica]QZD94130.1 gamma-glutamyltransferase [Qipengyuania gelatinilytica]
MDCRFLISLGALALASCAYPSSGDITETVGLAPSFKGAVTAADPRAQAAGEAILAKGGSATDAAIAVMLALTVVEPQSSGIGGGGFLVRGEADGDVTSFDGRETAPAGATPEWFLDENGETPPFMQSVRSGLSVGVPGNIALAAKAHAAHGRLDWAELFEPAIELAREGFQINPRMHDSLTRSKNRAAFSAEARALFYDASGNALPVGTVVRNEALAKTLESLAAGGREAFYSGPLALALATTVAADTPKPGAMTYDDVAGYDAKEREPVCSSYRKYRICSMGPPTSGGVAVQQMLLQLERFDLAALGAENPVTWHLFLESQRLAYADREIYLADSDYVKVPVAGLLDRNYLAERSALISAEGSMAEALPGTPPGASAMLADGDEPEENGTSHFAVVDSDNTMVSYTSTVEGPFGSGLMVDGFYLNNELTDFSRSPVVDGRLVANRVEGGKRPRSSMAPTIVYDPQGRPFMAVGAAGGSTIPVTTARAIIGAIDFGLSAEDSLRLPFLMAFGQRVMIEEGTWLEAEADAFRALGHEELIVRQAPIKAGALLFGADGWQSARDPRLEGYVDMP